MKTRNSSQQRAKLFTGKWAAALLLAAVTSIVLFTGCPNATGGGKVPAAEYAVNFGTDGTPPNGTLKAEVDGKAINTGDKVQEGKTVKFIAAPNAGYEVNTWTITGGTFSAGGTSGSTTAEVKVGANLTVKVTFKLKTAPTSEYTVNFSVDGTGGSLKAEVDGAEITAGAKVQAGKTVKFTAKPDGGYKVDTWNVTGGTVTSGGESGGTAAEVEVGTEDLTVKVIFKPEGTTPPAPSGFTVTFGVDGANGTLKAAVGGTAITSPAEVEQGKTVVFTAKPEAGYRVKARKSIFV